MILKMSHLLCIIISTQFTGPEGIKRYLTVRLYMQLGVSGEAVKVDIVHLDIQVGAVLPLPIAQKPNCVIGGKQSSSDLGANKMI